MYTLAFERARLQVRLGCGADERAVPQAVDLGVSIDLPGDPPPSCVTDRLEDTVCYATLIDESRALCASREFHLVEHLAYSLGQRLVRHVPAGASLTISVTKCAPPVEGLAGGVSFRMTMSPRAAFSR
jgi:dihydroneopterin aldolase